MVDFWVFTQFLFLFFASLFPASESDEIKALTQTHRVAGVFMIIEGGKYTMNFDEAQHTCLSLKVTMATLEQMQQAFQQGLETCKFGWTADQVAVVPRLTSDVKCGKGNTGVVEWKAKTDQKFGVFCFNASDLNTSELESTFPNETSAPTRISTTDRTFTQSTTTTSTNPTTMTTMTTTVATIRPTSFTSAFNFLVQTTRSTISSSSVKPQSTVTPTSLSDDVTSQETTDVTFTFSSTSSMPPPPSSSRGVTTAIIILVVVGVLVAAAAVFMWQQRKLKIFRFWSRQQNDDTETEMWKETGSEMDLRSRHDEDDEDDEDSDRKYSSDVTHVKVNGSE